MSAPPSTTVACPRRGSVQVTLRGPREEADADLDVIDVPALVDSWARSVAQDWSA